jgi:glycosyltransferase involved in cell wall biosynthesis
MKIGIDIQCLTRPLTGVGYYTLGILKGLASLPISDQIFPFYFSSRGHVELPAKVYKKMAPMGKKIPGRLMSLGWKRLGFPPVNWLIRGMDLYHFPDFIARPVRRKPVVTTIYDLSFKRYPEFTEPKNLKYLETSIPGSIERSDRIIVISEFTRDELTSLYPVSDNKITVVHGGIDDIFHEPLTEDDLMRVRFRFNLPEKYILTVGTWEPRKNLVRLLQAWRKLRMAGKLGGYKLVMVGMKGWLCGEIEQKFRNQAGQRGVMSIGYVPRTAMPAIYRGASAFIYPSIYEGLGLPPLEALACGVPVAAARAGAIPEVLGEAALYFDPSDPREIAEAMDAVITREELSAQLRQKGEEQIKDFTWENAAEKTIQVYRNACGIGEVMG